MHLPHYAVTSDNGSVHVLAKQPIDQSRPHPFVEAGNTEFNMFLWMPPDGDRAGDVLFADSTIFSTLFGADDSLRNFWRNIATARWPAMSDELELDDIQSGVLRPRPTPYVATYIAFRIDDPKAGRDLMARIARVVT